MKSTSARSAIVLSGLACIGALLVARAWYSTVPGNVGDLRLIRVAVPSALVFVMAFLVLDTLFNKRSPLIPRIMRRSWLPSVTTYVFTLAMCILDVRSGIEPYLLMPGLVVFGSLAWTRPRIMAVMAALGAVSVGVAAFLMHGTMGIETAMPLVMGFILAVFGADIVKRNVTPNEEKLKTLEMENKALWDLSYHDPLTGLYNRRYVQQIATHLLTRASRYREQLHILMIDIDHFKRVNDKLGHQVGDEVLKGVAATIQSFVRTSDAVARYGGEEFIVYLVQSNPEYTQNIANRIRDGVASMHFESVPWTVTISIGVAGLKEGDDVDSLIARSDHFLYMSKRLGRNRVSGF